MLTSTTTLAAMGFTCPLISESQTTRSKRVPGANDGYPKQLLAFAAEIDEPASAQSQSCIHLQCQLLLHVDNQISISS